MLMRSILTFVVSTLMMLVCADALAQSYVELVHLKNGSVVRGTVIEQIPGESIKVQTKDGSVFVYKMDEVSAITKEEKASSFSGLPFSLGAGFNENQLMKPRLGVTLGINTSKITHAMGDVKVGINGGLEIDYPFTPNFYANGRVLFSTKGLAQNWGEIGKEKVTLGYIEVPLHIGYKTSFSNAFSIFADAGPYIALGVLYKHSFSSKLMDKWGVGFSDDAMDEWENKERNDWKRFDAGIGLNAGFEIQRKYRLTIGYDWGLMGLFKDGDYIDADSDTKNRNLHIGVSYMF